MKRMAGELELIWMIISFITIPLLGVIVAFLAYDSLEIRAKIGNLMKPNKNYGIIDIAERGNKITPHVVSFNETLAELGKRTFIIPVQVRVRNSLPYAYFPYNDALMNLAPRDDNQVRQGPRNKAQEPEVLNAAIMAVKARSEAEALAFMKTTRMIMYIIVLLGLLSVVIGYLGYDKIGTVSSQVAEVFLKMTTTIKG